MERVTDPSSERSSRSKMLQHRNVFLRLICALDEGTQFPTAIERATICWCELHVLTKSPALFLPIKAVTTVGAVCHRNVCTAPGVRRSTELHSSGVSNAWTCGASPTCVLAVQGKVPQSELQWHDIVKHRPYHILALCPSTAPPSDRRQLLECSEGWK